MLLLINPSDGQRSMVPRPWELRGGGKHVGFGWLSSPPVASVVTSAMLTWLDGGCPLSPKALPNGAGDGAPLSEYF